MGKKAPHADALNIIAYGMAKFAGSEKGNYLFAKENLGYASRSSFYKELVRLGLAKSLNALSNRQDGFDCVFDNGKVGWKTGNKPKQYKDLKAKIDAVAGNLDANEFACFAKAVIEYEIHGEAAVPSEYLILIKQTISVLNGHAVETDFFPDSISSNTKPIEKVKLPEALTPDTEIIEITEHEERLHTEAQWLLIQIGKLTGCDVFIARNDASTMYHGAPLSEECIASLPKTGLDDKAYKRASLIDIIWVEKRKIVCAFEVECSTSIYSGILRMSDLAYSIPYDSISCYIVAQNERMGKVVEQLERPTFLNDYVCLQYISIEDLKDLYDRLILARAIPGSINRSILSNYSHKVEQ